MSRNFDIKSRNVYGYLYRGELPLELIKKKHKKDITKIRRNLIKNDTKEQIKQYYKNLEEE